jgi:hypothetical protein
VRIRAKCWRLASVHPLKAWRWFRELALDGELGVAAHGELGARTARDDWA